MLLKGCLRFPQRVLLQGVSFSLLFALTMSSARAQTEPKPEEGNYQTYTNTKGWCETRNLPVMEFKFNYPESMKLVEDYRLGLSNYVKVEWASADGVTAESFAVGSMTSEAGYTNEVLRYLAGQIVGKLSADFPKFKLVYGDMSTMGELKGYEVAFYSSVPHEVYGKLEMFGRVFLVPYNETLGAVMLNIVTNRTRVLKRVQDIGKVGNSKIIQESFEFIYPEDPNNPTVEVTGEAAEATDGENSE